MPKAIKALPIMSVFASKRTSAQQSMPELLSLLFRFTQFFSHLLDVGREPPELLIEMSGQFIE